MNTLIRIGIEISLVIATLFAGHAFWELRKRDRFLKKIISNQAVLERLISRQVLVNASQHKYIAPLVEKNEIGWFLNIKCVLDADRTSSQRILTFSVIGLAVILTASLFLGYPYLVINLIVFVLLHFGMLSQAARNSALQHVWTIALILDKWRSDNATECEEWIEKANSLRPLYNVVCKAR
jgi:formate hydrogenlyase subunit 3/multisubunit Na+/H+ antiporter MnhD subunit